MLVYRNKDLVLANWLSIFTISRESYVFLIRIEEVFAIYCWNFFFLYILEYVDYNLEEIKKQAIKLRITNNSFTLAGIMWESQYCHGYVVFVAPSLFCFCFFLLHFQNLIWNGREASSRVEKGTLEFSHVSVLPRRHHGWCHKEKLWFLGI